MNAKNKETWNATIMKGVKDSAAKGAATTLEDRFSIASHLSGEANDTVSVAVAPTPGASNGRVSIAAPIRIVPLASILDRAMDLRPLNEQHAKALALSFSAVGMLQPPVVDENNRLLAGAHRRAAVHLLQALASASDDDIRGFFPAVGDDEPLTAEAAESIRKAWSTHFSEGVPVRVIDTSPYSADEIRLIIETVENELRLDFSKTDLEQLIERLKQLGYKNKAGRPSAGERVLSHELARITKKSTRTVFRMIKEMREGKHHVEPIEPSRQAKVVAAKIEEKLDAKVRVRESRTTRGEGVISIVFTSFQQRAKILDAIMSIKD